MHNHDTRRVMYTSLCVWEWMLENKGTHQKLAALFDDEGTCNMRNQAIDLSRLVLEVQDLLLLHGFYLEKPFDWDFVPAVMNILIEYDDPLLTTSPAQIAIALKSTDSERPIEDRLLGHPGLWP